MNLFKKRKYVPVNINISYDTNLVVPDGLWVKCTNCRKVIYNKELSPFKICPNCNGHFRLSAFERLALTIDNIDAFEEFDKNLSTVNIMNYPGYIDKISQLNKKTGLIEAVICGLGTIENIKCVICIMDSNFIMGSMGSVVGEKITRSVEYATSNNLPIIIFTASGGARMQEGIISLMQMAKVSSALKKHDNAGLLYITVITDPTTGGVTASFAMLGDIIISEPHALIGFAGRRVIEQTIKQKLPDDFQTAEFLLEHGFIDKIVHRKDLKLTLYKILIAHTKV